MPYEDRYTEFEQYLASGKYGVEERARDWSMAIGLQDVDRLKKPSEFLLKLAMNINIFNLTFLLICGHYGKEN